MRCITWNCKRHRWIHNSRAIFVARKARITSRFDESQIDYLLLIETITRKDCGESIVQMNQFTDAQKESSKLWTQDAAKKRMKVSYSIIWATFFFSKLSRNSCQFAYWSEAALLPTFIYIYFESMWKNSTISSSASVLLTHRRFRQPNTSRLFVARLANFRVPTIPLPGGKRNLHQAEIKFYFDRWTNEITIEKIASLLIYVKKHVRRFLQHISGAAKK